MGFVQVWSHSVHLGVSPPVREPVKPHAYRMGLLLDIVFLHLVVEQTTINLETVRSLRFIATRLGDGLHDRTSFQFRYGFVKGKGQEIDLRPTWIYPAVVTRLGRKVLRHQDATRTGFKTTSSPFRISGLKGSNSDFEIACRQLKAVS